MIITKFKRFIQSFFILYLNLHLSFGTIEEVTLKCDEIERSYEYVDMYCTVTNFHVKHNQQVKIARYPIAKSSPITFIKFYDSEILFIPQKLFSVFYNLKNLDVAYSKVIEIPKGTFVSGDKLIYLNASHNEIKWIKTSVFLEAPALQRIDLSHNQITELNEHSFKGLPDLDRLALSYNYLKELHKDIFDDNLHLESIALDNNQIETLHSQTLGNLPRLRVIDLTNNKLTKIDPNIFQSVYGIESVMVSGNMFTEFHLNIGHLLNLYVNNNKLNNLVVNSTKNVMATNNNITTITFLPPIMTEKLFLSNNSLVDIKNITNITNLVALDLSNNKIGVLNIKTFNNQKKLRELYLRNSSIKGINFGTFSKQTNLEILDLSYNNLGTLNLDVFVPYLSTLQEFYIDGNNLTELRGKSISYAFPKLSSIGLSNNNFNCTYLHNIITSPYLPSYLKVRVEDEASTNDDTHIRGVICRSNVTHQSDNQKSRNPFQDTIDRLRIHEAQLELHLNLIKIFIGSLCIVVISVILYKVVVAGSFSKESLIRSISYRSSVTVNSNVDM